MEGSTWYTGKSMRTECGDRALVPAPSKPAGGLQAKRPTLRSKKKAGLHVI